MNLVCSEFMQHRHGNCTVCESCKESHGPTCAVSSAKRYSVTFYYSAVLKQNMQLFYFPCNIFVLQGYSFVICQSIKVPVLDDALLYQRIYAWY